MPIASGLALIFAFVICVGTFITQPVIAFVMLGLIVALPVGLAALLSRLMNWGVGFIVGVLAMFGGVWGTIQASSSLVDPNSNANFTLVILAIVMVFATLWLIASGEVDYSRRD